MDTQILRTQIDIYVHSFMIIVVAGILLYLLIQRYREAKKEKFEKRDN